MTHSGIALFLTAYATAAALPGPGLAALLARVIGGGSRGIAAYIAGFVAGDLIWFAAAATGMAALMAAFEPLVLAIRFAGVIYLLCLAYRLMASSEANTSPHGAAPTPSGHGRDFVTGLALTLGNPKTVLFFVALLPAVLDIKALDLASGLVIAGLMVPTLSVILGTYALIAARSRQLLSGRTAVRAMNVGAGAVMAGAALAIAVK